MCSWSCLGQVLQDLLLLCKLVGALMVAIASCRRWIEAIRRRRRHQHRQARRHSQRRKRRRS